MDRLKDKVAIIYGNGAVGSAIARAFAREGAKVFLAGRTSAKLTGIAEEIRSDGGIIETSILDALDESAVEDHMDDVMERAGKIDISFNAVGLASKNVQHSLLTELSLENFTYPINLYTRSHFVTAKAAANRMVKQGGGVILMHTSNLSHVSSPLAGGRAAAWAALEALCRSLSVECGQRGVRVVCLFTTAIRETPIIEDAFKELFESTSKANGTSAEQFDAMVVAGTHLKRLTTLRELTDAAVFAASDEASAITGTVLNLTAGMVV